MNLDKLAIATGGVVVAASKSKSHLIYMNEGSGYHDLMLNDLQHVFNSNASYCIINTSKHLAYFFWAKGVVTETRYLDLEIYARKAVAGFKGDPKTKKELQDLLLGSKEKIDGVPVSIFASIGSDINNLIGSNDPQIIAIVRTFGTTTTKANKTKLMTDIKYKNPFEVLPRIIAYVG